MKEKRTPFNNVLIIGRLWLDKIGAIAAIKLSGLYADLIVFFNKKFCDKIERNLEIPDIITGGPGILCKLMNAR